MKIAVGTTRKPKLDAVKNALTKLYPNKNIEIIAEKVESDVSDQPMSLKEIAQGAYNRAHNLIKKDIQADYYLGIEGGIWDNNFVNNKRSFLTGVVYVTNKKEDGFGYGPSVELTKYMHKQLFERGRELADVIDEITNKTDVRSGSGTIGELTKDNITRSKSFEDMIIIAMSKFYNSELYDYKK